MPAKASAPRRRQQTPAATTKARGAKTQSKRSSKAVAQTSPAAPLLCSKANPVNQVTLAKTPTLDRLECPGCGGRELWRNDGKEKTWFGCAGACNTLARELVNNRSPDDTRTYSSTCASRDKKTKVFESWVPSAVRASASATSSPVKRTAAVQPAAARDRAPVTHKTSHGDTDGDGDSGDPRADSGDADCDSDGSADAAGMPGADDGEDGWTSSDDEVLEPPAPRSSPDTAWFDSRREVTISMEKLNGKKFLFNIKTAGEWFFYYSMPSRVDTYMQHYRGVYALEAFDALGEREWVPFSDATRWHGVRIANDKVRLRVTHATHPLGHPEGPPPPSPVNTDALALTGAQPAAQTSKRKSESTSSVVDLTLSDEEVVPNAGDESDDNISFVTSPPPPPKKKRASEKDDATSAKPLKPTKTAAAPRAAGSTPKTAATAGSTPKTAAAPRAAGSTPKTAATAGSTPKTAAVPRAAGSTPKTAAAPRAAGSTPKTAKNAGSTPKTGQGTAPRADKTSGKRKAAAAPELEEQVSKKKRS